MEAQLSGSSTYHAQEYTESWIASVPSDSRFTCTSFMSFPPETRIDGKSNKAVTETEA